MLKRIIKKIIYGYKASSKDYLNYLKFKGVIIGDNCHIFCSKDTTIDVLNPHLLCIGNNVKITGPTTILTHDYSTCVLNHLDNKIYGKQRKTVIGNNVFLGWGCTILAGTQIADNTIIGAGSVVSGKLEKNSVYVGNPAKKICTIDEYRNKIQKRQLEDAKAIYLEYKRIYKKTPPIELFHEYFYIFSKKYSDLNNRFIQKLEEEQIEFRNNNYVFDNYEEFCMYCEDNKND